MNKLKIGITSGDINGIGLEVILEVLSSEDIRLKADFYIFSSREIIAIHQKVLTNVVIPFFKVQPGDELKPGTVGLPLPGVQVRIADKEGKEFARIIGSINFDDKKFIGWLKAYN